MKPWRRRVPNEADAPGVGRQLGGPLRGHRIRGVEYGATCNIHKPAISITV
jgi:hypothetical protein